MLSVAVDIWIGNAAAVLSGCWGAVSQRVAQAVVNEQAGGVSYEALWAENARLRAENAALWDAWAAAEQPCEAKQREFTATGSAMGLSLGQLITLLAIFLPVGRAPSR